MIKVLHIRRNPVGDFDGTDNYCQGLHKYLSEDPECMVMEVPDIRQTKSIFNYAYDNADLCHHIAQADIVHINGYTALGTCQALKIAKRMGKKVVYTAHWHPFSKLRRPMFGRIFFELLLKPYIKRYADVVTTINDEDTAFFRALHSNVVRIPHWNANEAIVDTSVVRKPNMILFVGRINDAVKGFFHVLSLPENKYEIHCVGKGEINTTRQDIIQHVNIPQNELTRLYAEASLVVIPSMYEAFSFVALEAMAAGTPVLMSQYVRIADYLAGKSGYSIFPFGNTDEFCKRVELMIGQKVDVEYIHDTFSPDKIISKYKELYMTI